MVNGYRLLADGDRVEFPDLHRSESPLKQAKTTAAALAAWLEAETGEQPGNFLSAYQTHHSPTSARGRRKKKVVVTY